MIHSASLTDPTVAYPHFNPYPTSNFPGPVVSLPEHHVSNAHPGSVNGLSSPTVAALTAAAAASAGIPPNVKDSRWLTLEVCRQYQRNQCSRDENECKFAHPPMHVDVQNGRVVCCYDSIKGKCQRRDPPCKYLHPPQHLCEQLMQNGRNSMIIRNLQLHLLQQQLIAQTNSLMPYNPPGAAIAAAAAAAAAAACAGPNSSPLAGTNNPNSLIYPGPGPMAMNNPAVSNAYPFLNLGFLPYLSALTGSAIPGRVEGSDVMSPLDASTTSTKRGELTDVKNGLPVYLPRSNGLSANGMCTNKTDAHEASPNCVMVVNGGGGPVNSLKEMNGSNHAIPVTLRSNSGTAPPAATNLYTLQHPQNTTLLNLPPPPPPPPQGAAAAAAGHPTGAHHHPMASLSAASLAAAAAAVINGNTVTPSHYSAVPDHTGYFQPTFHIEIPPYAYH